jgi:hypothetical protein
MKNENALIPQPFLDWYDIWPGQAGRDEHGRSWLEAPPQGVRLRVQPARMSDIFFQPECPWEGGGLGPKVILFDEGRYRMWYGVAATPDFHENFVCYAESDDGFDWMRPELGIYEFHGSMRNNIVCDQNTFTLNAVFVDPSAPAAERYKAINPDSQYYLRGALAPNTGQTKLEIRETRRRMELEGHTPAEIDAAADIRRTVRGAVSPDGLHWSVLDEPLLDVGKTMLDTQNIAAYDEDAGEYVAYLRGHVGRRRCVRRTGGKDFGDWHETRMVMMLDPQDEPDEDIYTSVYCRCPGSGRRLMFPSIFHRLAATLDVHLATSRDGWNWSRPERKPIIGCEIGDEVYGCVFARPNLLVLGDTWGLPCFCIDQRHDTWGAGPYTQRDYRWALWKPDRLVALEATAEGQFTTINRVCEGEKMSLNFQTRIGGWVKVALVHPPSTPPTPVTELEGFGMADCDPLEGDEVSKGVTWNGSGDLSSLNGQDICVHIRMSRAKLFSMAF